MLRNVLSAFLLSVVFTSVTAISRTALAFTEAPWLQQLSLDESPDLFFTPSPSGRKPFAEAMQKADKSIKLYMYRLTDGWMVQQLKAARARGVKVQVLLDPDKMKPKNTTKIVEGLIAAGVEVRGGSPRFTMSHAKTMIIDDAWGLITTMNLTWTFETSRGFGLLVRDQSAIAEIVKVFALDWKLANSKNPKVPNEDVYQDANLVWTPGNSEDKLIDLVRAARIKIEILVENLGATPLLQELTQAAARGVKVMVITPMCTTSINPYHNFKYIHQLQTGGVDVRSVPLPHTAEMPYSHGKYMAVDARYVYLGSQNFSKNSLQKARELGIVFEDSSVYRQIAEVWDKDWKVSVSVPKDRKAIECPGFN